MSTAYGFGPARQSSQIFCGAVVWRCSHDESPRQDSTKSETTPVRITRLRRWFATACGRLAKGKAEAGHHCGEIMWIYILVFFSALVMDGLPVIAPPGWAAMVFLLLKFHLPLGRYCWRVLDGFFWNVESYSDA